MNLSDNNNFYNHKSTSSSLIQNVNPHWPKAQVLKKHLTINTSTPCALAAEQLPLKLNDLPVRKSFHKRFINWVSTLKGKFNYVEQIKKQVT